MLVLRVNGALQSNGALHSIAVKKLEIKASLGNLNKALDFINTELDKGGCLQDIREKIEVAVEEIFVNIADYAYGPDGGNAVISISVTDKIVIRFEDTGIPYNPLDKQEPDLDKPPLERDIGGLGVFLVKKLMDNVEYTRIDNKNVLVMTKKVSS
jgi:anti-sigma regulatory factor (Ser/Thr protein kinase)